MKKQQHLLILLSFCMMILLAGCGKETSVLDQAGFIPSPAIENKTILEAYESANQLLFGEGVVQSGRDIYFRGVPLSVREEELASVLPNKEVLYLAKKYKAFPSKEELSERLGGMDLQQQHAYDVNVVMINRYLIGMLNEKVEAAWCADLNPWERIRHQERHGKDYQEYLEKLKHKDKIRLHLQR